MRELKKHKIGVLGGGITGLTAAYILSKDGFEVSLYEKESHLGGLASGFTQSNWEWPLERAYHHLFATDEDILGFAKEIGFNDIFFQQPTTSSLYGNADKFNIFPLDTPIDLLKLPLLSPIDKIRTGATLAFLKMSPFLKLYEANTAEQFLRQTMGEHVWNIMWEELFRKKFGKYAGNIVASFIWARINKRTKSLGYIKGGFQTFINFLENKNKNLGVVIRKGEGIESIKRNNHKFEIGGEEYDYIISTLPTTIMCKITSRLFSEDYLNQFSKLHYLHAVNLIIESEMPLLEKEYWLNICDPSIPIMVLAQHTNFIPNRHYGNNHILYIGNYVDSDSHLLKLNKDEALSYFMPHLKRINPMFKVDSARCNLFKAPWAQPLFDHDFVLNKPDFATPLQNFYIANLDMTYPYDRGTNYAVKLGKEVAALVIGKRA